jgi:hypothetical protein
VSVRAAWHTQELDVAVDDPFAPASPRVQDVGTPIDLKADDAAPLHARLVELLAVEAELDEQGVTCRIKDAHDTSCHACPLYCADGSPKARLCALGREQERICTRIVANHYGG